MGRSFVLAGVLASSLGTVPLALAGDVVDELTGSNRVLLVVTPSADDPRARRLDRALEAARCQLEDRDLVVVRLPASGPASAGGNLVEGKAASRLRDRFGAKPDDFLVLLFGKDGGEKFRSATVPDLVEVFRLIDGMPMRREEMRGHRPACGG